MLLDKEAIRADCDIMTVLYEIGCDIKTVGAKTSILCPLHNDTHFGSCVVTEYGCYCYVCNKSIDIFQIVMSVCSVSFPEAVKIIAEINGGVEKYGLSSSDAKNLIERKKGFISPDIQKKLGIKNKPVYENIGYTEDFFQMKDFQENKGGIITSSLKDEGYIFQKINISNPLYKLFVENNDVYRELIDRKCQESIDVIKSISENFDVFEKLFPFNKKCLDRISKIAIRQYKEISIEYGNGVA